MINQTSDDIGAIVREQRAWAAADSIAFFRDNRSRPEDLYPSERIFLPGVVQSARSVLDVGCACGGFAAIMQAFNPCIDYVGVDIVAEMLSEAGRVHTAARFLAAAGHALPFRDGAFDLVHCSGAVHLNSAYPALIAEMWRVARRHLLFDLRMTDEASYAGTFMLDFAGGKGELPYHVVNVAEARGIIERLPAPPRSVRVAGYRHPPSHNARLGNRGDLIMAFLLLARDSAGRGWDMRIEN
jgi:SAM-dependent methyltransferase